MHWLELFGANILPIFLAAAGGYWSHKRLEVTPKPLARVIFYLFSPALVFRLLVTNPLDGAAMVRIAAFALSMWLCLAAAAWMVGKGLRLPREGMAALVLVAVSPNAGNYGLSLNRFALGEAGLAAASVYFILSSVLVYSAGVFVASLGRAPWHTALRRTLRVPTVWAAVLGLGWAQQGRPLPLPVERVVSLFADATIPMLLVLLGVQTAQAQAQRPNKTVLSAVGLRLLWAPVVAWLIHPWFGLQGVTRAASLIEASMPSAVTTTMLAAEFDTWPEMVSQVVLWSTLLSPLTLTPLLVWLGV